MKPQVSICIPTYNGARFVEEAMSSSLGQSFEDFELLVSDDASRDETLSIVASFKDSRIRILRQKRNLGPVGNALECINAAQGQFVALLAQDDAMLPDNLERKVSFLRGHAEVPMVHSAALDVDENGRQIAGFWSQCQHRPGVSSPSDAFRSFFDHENTVCASTVMLRRTVFQEVGFPDPQLTFTADWDMWLRVAIKYPVGFIPDPIVRYRWHASNLTASFVGKAAGLEQRWLTKRLAIDRLREQTGTSEDLDDLEYVREAIHAAWAASQDGAVDEMKRLVKVATRIVKSRPREGPTLGKLVAIATHYSVAPQSQPSDPIVTLLKKWERKVRRLRYLDI